jgi:hypothetical protein
VSRDEVLGNRESFAVARDDRARDDLTLRFDTESTHAGLAAFIQLPRAPEVTMRLIVLSAGMLSSIALAT